MVLTADLSSRSISPEDEPRTGAGTISGLSAPPAHFRELTEPRTSRAFCLLGEPTSKIAFLAQRGSLGR